MFELLVSRHMSEVSRFQCMKLPPPPPSVVRSNGSNKLQAAVSTKMAAEVKTGSDGEMDRRKPADTGAMTPVLKLSACHSQQSCK